MRIMNILNFFKALARKTDPETSKQAASTVPVSKLENVVYEAIKASPRGLTTDEIEVITGLRPGSITPRIAPLIRKGYIKDSGERRTARSGKAQRVLTCS